MPATRLTIHGRVQGVFYRDWTMRTARELGVTGWVRNRDDGTVEAHVEGNRKAIDTMTDRMREGPPRAQVERIERAEADLQHAASFERR